MRMLLCQMLGAACGAFYFNGFIILGTICAVGFLGWIGLEYFLIDRPKIKDIEKRIREYQERINELTK